MTQAPDLSQAEKDRALDYLESTTKRVLDALNLNLTRSRN